MDKQYQENQILLNKMNEIQQRSKIHPKVQPKLQDSAITPNNYYIKDENRMNKYKSALFKKIDEDNNVSICSSIETVQQAERSQTLLQS